MAVYDAVSRIDRRLLPDAHIFGLRLWDFDFRFELVGIGHARQICSRRHLLPFLDWDELQHTFDPRAKVHGIVLAFLQVIERVLLLDLCFLRRKLRRRGIGRHARALRLQLQADR